MTRRRALEAVPSGNAVQPNATEFARVSPQQWKAIERLLAGDTVTDAASAAGVDRVTLWRWQRKDVAFQAALNRCRRDAMAAVYAQVLRLEG